MFVRFLLIAGFWVLSVDSGKNIPPLLVIESSSVSVNDDFPVNPFAFFPCFKTTCDYLVGCIDPIVTYQFIAYFPPVSACPEVYRKKTIRFLAVSAKKPHIIISPKMITPKSRVAILIHGSINEYNHYHMLIVLFGLLKHYDFVVIVDWNYLANPYFFDHIPAVPLDASLGQVNTLFVGRLVCEVAKWLIKTRIINSLKIRIIGFSSGAAMLSTIGVYCKKTYSITFGHFVGKKEP